MTDNPHLRVQRLLASSPFAMPRATALELMEERRKALLAAPPAQQPAIVVESLPMPEADLVCEPKLYAEDFWKDRRPSARPASTSTKQKKATSKKRGRKPVGNLDARHDKFRVIEGSGDKQR